MTSSKSFVHSLQIVVCNRNPTSFAQLADHQVAVQESVTCNQELQLSAAPHHCGRSLRMLSAVSQLATVALTLTQLLMH